MTVRTEGMKRLPIWIIVAVLLVGGVIGGVLAINSGEKVSVSQPAAPIVTTNPAKPEAIPETKPEASSSGVIEITAEKLVSEFLANPDKYKKGTVFQVSGVLVWHKKFVSPASTDFFLGPAVDRLGVKLGVVIHVDSLEEKELFKTFNALDDGAQVVVRGTYYFFSARSQGVSLENCSLISVVPAK